jgi:hypothetical protein
MPPFFIPIEKEYNKALETNTAERLLKDVKLQYVDSNAAGLPDVYLHNMPKRENIYQNSTILPNGHRIYQMALKY